MFHPQSRFTVNGVVLAVVGLFVSSGCAQTYKPTSGPMPTYQQPELLFLKAEPYRRLVVEIDSVQGSEPSAVTVGAVRKFLTKYCEKPDGIDIVVDKPIPQREARRLSGMYLTLKYMDIPRLRAGENPPAYFHVLIFDSSIDGAGSGECEDTSYVPFSYPCGIFIDLAYWGRDAQTYLPRVLCHEVGHILGLTKDTVHGDGAHCRNINCLMYPRHSPTRARTVPGYNDRFDICRNCAGDLNTLRDGRPDKRLSFLGPALVRTEETYRVVSLPDAVYWDFAPFKPLDWRTFRDRAVAVWQANRDTSNRYLAYRPMGPNDQFRFDRAVSNSLNDPDPGVANLMRRLSEQATFSSLP